MRETLLRLKKDHDRRLRGGHGWVYSNEVDTAATPLTAFEPGQPVDIVTYRDQWLGSGYVNPHSLICARIVSRDREHPLNRSLLVHRINIALSLRERLYPAPFYRLVYAESDGLPGLVVDRYGTILVVQLTTAGMERLREDVVHALDKVLKPTGILLRNDSSVRAMEGLSPYVEVAAGAVPSSIIVDEAGCTFEVSPLSGQKTGWYFDQAANRDRAMRHVVGRRVLDVCSYVGAWGIRAARAGAEHVTCLDVSATAVEAVARNATRNGLGDRVEARQGDAFDALRDLRAAGERFDVIFVDPPAFVKRRKDLEEGALAYRRLNEGAMLLLQRDGLLVTSSCSFHMERDHLLRTVQQAARHADRSLQLLEEGRQGPDHPVHPAMIETGYLKTFYLRVLPTF
jgi:23S rRNA (cytosine1962-C5)-methyltransferase